MAIPFLGKMFGDLLKKQSQSVLGVDIGSSSIKVVQLRKKGGKAVLETYGELALGPYAGTEIGRATNLPNDKLVEALRDLIKESNVTTKSAGIAISSAASLLSFIRMPEMDQKQLAAMIPIEARKYIPVPITEVALDWWVMPKEERSFSEFEKPAASAAPGAATPPDKGIDVLLVVIHNDVLNKLNQISGGAALETTFYEIEVFSSMRSVVDQSLESVMIFDMGAGTTKLNVIERGILRSSHTINRGSQEITLALSRSLGVSVGDAEHIKRTIGLSPDPDNKAVKEIVTLNLDYIFSETNRVIGSYERKYNKSISKVILTGGGTLLKGFLDLARTRFQTEVVAGDPFAKTEAPAFLEPVLRTAGPEFAVAIGIALRKLQETE
ncbi:MAG TPA: type IV pilus assembly protein PilM [Candidatus Paceibacterota bacterium]|nr:type IV pilus assembly protein PilM [Candidatus Paceibacterota bacterium]